MGFFNSGSYSAANIEDLLKDDTLDIHENLSFLEAAYKLSAENEMNWNAIMESVAMAEMEEMSSSGSDYSVVAEAGFFESVVAFFKKVWEKIKSLFKKFMVMIGSLVGKDKDFAKKHGDTIRKNMINIPNDAEIKGYKFTTDKLKGIIDRDSDLLAAAVAQLSEHGNLAIFDDNLKLASDDYDAADANELARATFCTGMTNASNRMTDADMRDAAFATARDNEDSPIDIKLDTSSVSAALSNLEKGDKAKSDANKLYTNQEKKWKTLMHNAEKFNTEQYKAFKPADSGDDAAKRVNTAHSAKLKEISNGLALCKSGAGWIQTMCSIYLQAVKDEYSQCRKICVKAVTYKAAKEGASVTHYIENVHFAGVNLI